MKKRKALISVSRKEGVVEFARELQGLGFEIILDMKKLEYIKLRL